MWQKTASSFNEQNYERHNIFNKNTLRIAESTKKNERESSASSYAKCHFAHIDNRRRLSSVKHVPQVSKSRLT